MTPCYRPLVQTGPRPEGAVPLAGGPLWFVQAERLTPQGGQIIGAADVPSDMRDRFSAPRAPVAGLDLSVPRIMGILNVTPDSFSDGGRHNAPDTALAKARQMAEAGADLLDIGGESTRPGAETVPVEAEIARTAPVIAAMTQALSVPISIDTRKAPVAQAALGAGAALINDVSGLTYDAGMAALARAANAPVCVMHALGDPATMQENPHYDNVLLDVYHWLSARIDALEAQGIPRSAIIADPGIGFGKTQAHNLTLLQNLSAFHGLGCAILLGASRKRFVGTIGKALRTDDRMPGSIAVGLAALAQGVQLLRVHDVAETAQAVRLWQAVQPGG